MNSDNFNFLSDKAGSMLINRKPYFLNPSLRTCDCDTHNYMLLQSQQWNVSFDRCIKPKCFARLIACPLHAIH